MPTIQETKNSGMRVREMPLWDVLTPYDVPF